MGEQQAENGRKWGKNSPETSPERRPRNRLGRHGSHRDGDRKGYGMSYTLATKVGREFLERKDYEVLTTEPYENTDGVIAAKHPIDNTIVFVWLRLRYTDGKSPVFPKEEPVSIPDAERYAMEWLAAHDDGLENETVRFDSICISATGKTALLRHHRDFVN